MGKLVFGGLVHEQVYKTIQASNHPPSIQVLLPLEDQVRSYGVAAAPFWMYL